MKKAKTTKRKWRIVSDGEKACLEFLDVADLRITDGGLHFVIDPKVVAAGLKALRSAKKKGA